MPEAFAVYSFAELPLDEQRALIAITQLQGIGPGIGRRLLEHFGSAVAVFDAEQASLESIEGIGPALAKRLQEGVPLASVDLVLRKLEQSSIEVRTIQQADYPEGLKRLSTAPLLLFSVGTLDETLCPDRMVAIVGTRHPDHRGVHLTRELSASLIEQGFTIVSGGALGIDTAAHFAALAHQGPTIAVLATGVDRAYPSQNRDLFRSIREQGGALVSEFLPGTMPERGYFPRRNRLISALCAGVVVVQCGAQSGALNTASHAMRLNIPVMALPGHPKEALAAGPHKLLRKGAFLVESGEDIAHVLHHTTANQALGAGALSQLSLWSDPPQQQAPPAQKNGGSIIEDDDRVSSTAPGLTGKELALNPSSRSILAQLDLQERQHVDAIASECGIPVSEVLACLLELELEGWVQAHPGMYFTRAVP